MSMDQVDAEVELLVRAGVVGEQEREKARRMLRARHALFHRIDSGHPRGNSRKATERVIEAIKELWDIQRSYEVTLNELEALAGDPRCEGIYTRLKVSVGQFSSACQSLLPRDSHSVEIIEQLQGEISESVRALQEVLKPPSSSER